MKRTESRVWSAANRQIIRTNVKWPGKAMNNKTRVVDEPFSKTKKISTRWNSDEIINILFEKNTLYGLGQIFEAWYFALSLNSPGFPCRWKAVDNRLACTATRLPPTPKNKRNYSI